MAQALGGTARTHESFGTASVELGSIRLDLAGTRREHYPRPAALPQVTRDRLAADLARRDFTINALAAPLAADGPLGLIDRVLDFQVRAILADGTTRTTLTGNDPWANIHTIEVTLVGGVDDPRHPIQRSVVSRFHPRNVLSL